MTSCHFFQMSKLRQSEIQVLGVCFTVGLHFETGCSDITVGHCHFQTTSELINIKAFRGIKSLGPI